MDRSAINTARTTILLPLARHISQVAMHARWYETESTSRTAKTRAETWRVELYDLRRLYMATRALIDAR